MQAYYNDNERTSIAWLKSLAAAGHITDGVFDDRSICEVTAADVVGFRRINLFAGVAGWERALQLAEWPADREIVTCSCPCPPFSAAGKKKRCPPCGGRVIPCPYRTGFFICVDCEYAWFADGRHLWPEVWRIISVRRPATIIGEQVAGADGMLWFSGVRASLELIGYRVGAADLAAAGVGAPHIRQRLFWVAHREGVQLGRGEESGDGSRVAGEAGEIGSASPGRSGIVGRLAHTNGWQSSNGGLQRGGELRLQQEGDGITIGLEHSPSDGWQQRGAESSGGSVTSGCGDGSRLGDSNSSAQERFGSVGVSLEPEQEARRSDDANPWTDSVLIGCADGKARRIKPGIEPLVNGLSGRVGLLRGYGNAIVPQVAAEFIKAFLESESHE